MPGGKKFKAKLHQYQTTKSHTQHEDNINANSLSVTEKIKKSRVEQARAKANRERRMATTSTATNTTTDSFTDPLERNIDPTTFWLLSQSERGMATMTLQTPTPPPTTPTTRAAAGPPPPPSWRRQPVRNIRPRDTSPSSLSSRRQRRRRQEYPFHLLALCAHQLQSNLPYYSASISALPRHIKQHLLYEWSLISQYGDTTDDDNYRSVVSDATLKLFQKTEYEELWLEASHVSLERLLRSFWQVKRLPLPPSKTIETGSISGSTNLEDDLVDDWEDLISNQSDSNNDADHLRHHDDDKDGDDDGDVSIPTFILDLQQQEQFGQWSHLYKVIAYLRPEINQLTTITPDGSSSTAYALSSPYLSHLVSLNISFMQLVSQPDFSWITFSHLLASTLPHLQWLYSAGCFPPSQGPTCISILSHGLRKLKFWDLSHHHAWLTLDILTSSINWQNDLLELRTLCLSTSLVQPTREWFRDHPPLSGRIKIRSVD